jgi:hypothetical protein
MGATPMLIPCNEPPFSIRYWEDDTPLTAELDGATTVHEAERLAKDLGHEVGLCADNDQPGTVVVSLR